MKRALIRNSLIVLIILVLVTGISSFIIIKDFVINKEYDEIEKNLNGFIIMICDDSSIDLSTSSKDFAEYTGARITVIDAKTGKVLGDSNNDITSMDNHLYREEVTEAINTGEGTSMRYSNTEKVDFLYYAKTVSLNGQDLVVRAASELYAVKDAYNSAGFSMLITLLISALIAFLMTFSFNNKVVKPIADITELATDISKGNYGKSAYITSYKEVEKLSGALNTLSKSLKVSFDSMSVKNAQLEAILYSFNHGILVCDNEGDVQFANKNFSKILGLEDDLYSKNIYMFMFDENIYSILEEIKLLNDGNSIYRENVHFSDGTFRNYSGHRIIDSTGTNKGILLAVEDVTNVRKLERMRSTFVSNVTHELKTPITCISGYTQTLLNGALYDKENALRFLQIIDEEAQRLNLLIDDILTLSEIENKSISFDTKVNLIEIAQDVIALMEQKYPIRPNVKQQINADVNEAFEIHGDKNKIKQILINLVDNSIKHTSEGFININFKKNDTTVTMQVQDTGIGIEEKHLSRLFERFYRVDKHRSRETGGTGLGLSIVKHLTLLHHGRISIESKLGQGTTISIEFPLPGGNNIN